MLDIAEYKRRQAPPGVKITARAFGRGFARGHGLDEVPGY